MSSQQSSTEVRPRDPTAPLFRWWIVADEEWTPPNRYYFGLFLFAQLRGQFGGTSYRYFALVLWPLPVALGPAGFFLFRSGYVAAVRAERGQCSSCGYDRAGLATEALCPECGCRSRTSPERERAG